MTARHLDPDAAFFAEWAARRPGQRRDLDRAEKIAAELGAFPVGVPVLTVVGSKGKGTAAVNAAAALAAHRRADGQHLRVGLVTSPAHRTNTERIRLDGLSIAEATYAQIAAGLTAARHAVDVTDGYLSPTGAFTVAGVAWLHRRCDVLVVEEGLGGASDEVSLFAPDVVALTEVFVEHAALLGDSPGAIAADLLAVVRAGTSAVVTGPQSPSVTTVVRHVARRTGAQVHQVPSGHPRRSDELAQANRALGVQAAAELARRHRWTATDADIEAVLATVRTPGRGSWHRWRGADIMVDGAISPTGVRAAAVQHTETTGRLAHAVLCLPDDKDV
ncbi:MAG: hypothetical protein FWE61_06380, partial [Micrococcales bacterium]|nr:hypothetical protein [Micrococcales bacterium]